MVGGRAAVLVGHHAAILPGVGFVGGADGQRRGGHARVVPAIGQIGGVLLPLIAERARPGRHHGEADGPSAATHLGDRLQGDDRRLRIVPIQIGEETQFHGRCARVVVVIVQARPDQEPAVGRHAGHPAQGRPAAHIQAGVLKHQVEVVDARVVPVDCFPAGVAMGAETHPTDHRVGAGIGHAEGITHCVAGSERAQVDRPRPVHPRRRVRLRIGGHLPLEGVVLRHVRGVVGQVADDPLGTGRNGSGPTLVVLVVAVAGKAVELVPPAVAAAGAVHHPVEDEDRMLVAPVGVGLAVAPVVSPHGPAVVSHAVEILVITPEVDVRPVAVSVTIALLVLIRKRTPHHPGGGGSSPVSHAIHAAYAIARLRREHRPGAVLVEPPQSSDVAAGDQALAGGRAAPVDVRIGAPRVAHVLDPTGLAPGERPVQPIFTAQPDYPLAVLGDGPAAAEFARALVEHADDPHLGGKGL